MVEVDVSAKLHAELESVCVDVYVTELREVCTVNIEIAIVVAVCPEGVNLLTSAVLTFPRG